jgi:adenylate cyclase
MARCGSCTTELPAAAKFCPECGRAVGEPPAADTRDPSSYTPKHLAQKILTSRGALEGERKQVTVLFADVAGSMELAERLGPEEWHRVLDRFFRILSDGVHRFEGTVNQYTGDGIMALFGAPIAHEDHAHRACRSALSLRDSLRDYRDQLRRELDVEFPVRIGLNSGDVVVGKIGDDLRMDYTAQGYAVGLAARVEETAPPGEIHLTDRTARLVEGFFRLRDLGTSDLRGARDPVRTFALEGTGPIRTRLEAVRVRRGSTCVGRETELEYLRRALEEAADGYGRVVHIVGDAGVGKSRLCLEFIERFVPSDTPVYSAHCPPHGRSVPLLPIVELLRSCLGIESTEDEGASRRRVEEGLERMNARFADALDLTFDLLGISEPRSGLPIGAEERRRRVAELLGRLVQGHGEAGPAVWLIDDLHWVDPESETLLGSLVEALGWTRNLLLVNHRPEYGPGWSRASYVSSLQLAPLDARAATTLIGELLGEDPSVAELASHIRDRSVGNPFFIEELVRHLSASGALAGERGRYRLTVPLDDLEIPESVHAVLAARLDLLSDAEKHALQTAAVLGRRFPSRLLTSVLGQPEGSVGTAVESLRTSGLLEVDADDEIAFRHPLIQQVAYQGQIAERRQKTHAAVAEALEEIHADRLGEQASLIAHHWDAAGEPGRARIWRRRAALRVSRIQVRRGRARRDEESIP